MNTLSPITPILCSLSCALLVGVLSAQGQGYQSAGGSGGGFGEIPGLPPQVTTVAAGPEVPFHPGPQQVDPFYQPTTAAAAQLDVPREIPVTRSFTGIGYTGWIPPDPIIAAGPDHLVACVNSSIAFYTKEGARFSQTTANTFFGSMASGYSVFDPWVVYDRFSNRFMVLYTSTRKDTRGNVTASRYFLGISKTSNPASGWWLYWFDNTFNGGTRTTNWADYPRLATDENAIYITGNMFGFSTSVGFQYCKIRILQAKSDLIRGVANTSWWDFWDIRVAGSTTKAFTIQPCHDYDDKTLGSPAYFVSCVNGTGSNLYFYAINNVTRRTAPTPAMFRTSVAVQGYSSPGNSRQRGGTEVVENVAPRLMNAVKRNGAIWCAHSVALASGAGAGAQWYECRVNSWPTSGSMTRRQQQLFFGGTNYYYTFPSVAVNQNNDMAMVFGRSHTTLEYLGCRITGRLSTAALNSLDGSITLKDGAGYYVRKSNGRNRWGDYFGCAADPQGNFWYLGQWATSNNQWSTQIGMTQRAPVAAYVPDASATTGSCNVIPFGQKNQATWENQKYQQLVTAADLGNPDIANITDLGFVSCVTGRRHFDRIVVRLAQTNQTSLGTTFSANLDANLVTVLNKSNYEWHQVADQWSQLGLDRGYVYDASRGRNLVIEIEVRGANVVTSSTAFPGHRTGSRERVFAYNWTTPPATGSRSPNSGLKVQVLVEGADIHDYGVGCLGSNRRVPVCSITGTGRIGSTYRLNLSNALPNANTFISVGLLPRLTVPLDLRIIGAAGCMWNFNNDITLTGRCNSSGSYSLTLPVGATTETGARIYFQFFPFDRAANGLGLTTSNYTRLLTGY